MWSLVCVCVRVCVHGTGFADSSKLIGLVRCKWFLRLRAQQTEFFSRIERGRDKYGSFVRFNRAIGSFANLCGYRIGGLEEGCFFKKITLHGNRCEKYICSILIPKPGWTFQRNCSNIPPLDIYQTVTVCSSVWNGGERRYVMVCV